MIKFGLDKLLQSEESSVVDVDLKAILGGSIKGEWVLEENTTKDEEEKEDKDDEKMTEEDGDDDSEKESKYCHEV